MKQEKVSAKEQIKAIKLVSYLMFKQHESTQFISQSHLNTLIDKAIRLELEEK